VLVAASLTVSVLPPLAAASTESSSMLRSVSAPVGVELTALEVEKKAEPIGIDSDQPRFSWVIESEARDVTQESYRLRVATEAEGLDGDLTWDSGMQTSVESAEVAYDGPDLDAATGYVWGVDILTSDGAASATSRFRTGLRTEADWAGSRWIGNERPVSTSQVTLDGASWIHPPYSGANTPPGYFRQSFTVDPTKEVASSELVMSGDLGFSAFLNGEQIASGPSVADAWKKATRVAVAPEPGVNLLAVRLNNTAKPYAAVVGKLVVRYTDGSTEEVATDDSWLSTTTATTGWHLPDYAATGWVRATARASYGGAPWGSQIVIPGTTTPDAGMNMDNSSWIIPDIGAPSASNPIPTTLFRRTIEVADRKVLWAQLSITGDPIFTAYWNGTQVAANTGAANEWQQARTINLSTAPGANTLAVRLQTPGTSESGGVLGRVRIAYADGTFEDVVTDGDTKALAIGTGAAPAGWLEPGFDDSAWTPARAQSLYRGGVYGDRVTVPQVATGSEKLTLEGARWIWTPEATSPVAPAEDRVFRTTRTSPAGKVATEADLLIAADDSYRLFVNGHFIGNSEGVVNDWQQSRLYSFDLDDSRNVFAVRTTNGPDSAAGMIAVIRVHYSDGSSEVFTTDTTWKASKTIPTAWADGSYDDSSWGNAVSQGVYGGAPWNRNVRDPKPEVAPAPLLRKEFEIDREVANATVYVAAGGYADVSLNGGPISADVLSPGFTDYDDTVQYVATDVTDLLDIGSNALGLELGRGFFGMTGGNVWNWQSPPWHDEPTARAVLEIEYADGGVDNVITDDSWTIHDGPTRSDDLYGGETYDASRVQTGFATAGFDDAGWDAASEVSGPKGELVNQRQQPIRVTESLPATAITEPIDGTYVVKFPRVLAGWVQVTAQGPAGTVIRLQAGEKLRDSGRVNFDNNGNFQAGFQTDRFLLAGTGAQETWEPKFSYQGFQYIEVTGWPGEAPPPLSAFTAKAVHTDAPRTGSFESSSETMNATHEAVVDTLYNNLHGVPTDTPMFEKNGWTGDAAVGAEMFMMNIDTHELFAKWMRDVNDTREPNGRPMVIAPSSGGWGQWGIAPAWHAAYVMIPWWLYQYGGDDRVLRELYDGMKKYVDLEFVTAGDGIVKNVRLGDWVSPEASPAGGNAPEDRGVSGTAYLYAMLTSMARSAEYLGKSSDAEQFLADAAVVKEAFNKTYFDASNGYYRGTGDTGYRQTHNVLALAFDLVPPSAKEQVAASIVADVKAKGGHLNTGVLGTKYLLPVLTENGYGDIALQLAEQTTYPSWGYMIDQGATSMWEHWSTAARSYGHYFLGTVDDWFFHYTAGIRASEQTGYRDVTIAPAVTGDLDSARATTDTPFGPVTSDWRHEDGDLVMEVTVPVGSTGHVVVPAENSVSVSEGGVVAEGAEGVRDSSYADGALNLTVGSGHYEFRVNADLVRFGRVMDRIAEARVRTDLHRDTEDLTPAEHALVSAGLTEVADGVQDIVEAVLADEATVASRLDAVLTAAVALRTATAASSTEAPVREDLVRHLDRVVSATEALVSSQLGVVAVVPPLGEAARPGDVVEGSVTISNAGSTTLTGLSAEVVVGDWLIDGSDLLLESLGAEATVTLSFTATVPPGAALGGHEATVSLTYNNAEKRRQYTGTGPWVEVTSGLDMTSVQFASPAAETPGLRLVTATVNNTGSASVSGRVELTAPAGWPATVPSELVTVPANTSIGIEVPLLVGSRLVAGSYDVKAAFVRGVDTMAERTAPMAVTLPTPPAVAIDHVDFGESGSEAAHAVLAAPNSGATVEAGLTRRYAHSAYPGSWFSAAVHVNPGEPFGLRMIETFDRPVTKEFNLYVDDVPVGRYNVTRTQSGAGWMADELLVDDPAAVAATLDGTVRLKFEYPLDARSSDPSIADLWVLPGLDTTAPLGAARLESSYPGNGGWFRGPVDVSVRAADNRAGTTVQVGGPDGWLPYTGPVQIAGDGEHRVDYRVRDLAGNSTGARSATVRIDGTAPATVLELAGTPRSDMATMQLKASDEGSGVAATTYRVDGGEWTERGAESFEVVGHGEHVIEALSSDVAGNTEVLRRMVVTLVEPSAEPGTGPDPEPTPLAVVAPQVTGTEQVGAELAASPGAWNRADLGFTFQWQRNDQPIPGATTASYRLGAVDVGTRLSVRVTAISADGTSGAATSGRSGIVMKANSAVRVTTSKRAVRAGKPLQVRVVVTSPTAAPSGKVTIWVDGVAVRNVPLAAGRSRVRVVLRGKGIHRIEARYAGAADIARGGSKPIKVRVR
jgi:hypothetical protein